MLLHWGYHQRHYVQFCQILSKIQNLLASLNVNINCIFTRIILCLVTLELWLPDMYSFVVFLLWQKTNLTIFKRNCFTLVLRILITIIPAAVLSRQQNIYVYIPSVLMPCPSMWPKQFWSVQNGFGLTKLIWTWP